MTLNATMKYRWYLQKCVILFVLISCSTTSAQEIWRKVYAYQYELTFYASVATSYDNAKQICDSISAKIVQLDNEYVRKAVYFTIKSSTLDRFWIGAIRSSTNVNEWNWESGSAVDTSTVEWYNDNTNLSSNNTIIRTSDNNLVAKHKSNSKSGTICQYDRGLSYPRKVDTPKYRVTIYNQKDNWNDAVSRCNDINAAVVQLDNADVKQLVNGLFASVHNVAYFWIGLTRTCAECSEWVWVDETAANSLDWHHDEPNNNGGSEDKVVLHNNNKLYDTNTEFDQATVICQQVLCDITPSVCENGATCNDGTSGIISCECTEGYYGLTCSKQYCEAHVNPCKNSGTCSFFSNDPYYNCTCAANGYYGNTCEDDYCATYSDICKNGGTCSYISSSPFYTCNCSANGYYGNTCEERFCEANTNPCENHGACSSIDNDPFYSCTCASNGYYGKTCTDTFCDINPNTCKHSGTCSRIASNPFYNCTCAGNGYYGQICNDNYCVTNPDTCKNGGTCLHKSTSPFYTCHCAANGYYGTTCKDNYCVKNPNTCKNGGTCSSKSSSPFYTCYCAKNGYYGNTCEDTYCVTNPDTCKNGGACLYKSSTPFYTCNCVANGYYGTTCEDTFCDINPNTCKHSGTCSRIASNPFYKCTCAGNGYYGQTCNDNYCVTNPNTCKNGGTCSQKSTSPFYTCNCGANGYYGTTCEDTFCDINPNTCKHSGTCSRTASNPFYKCTCAGNGYYGQRCNDNYCVTNSNTCKNGGTCSRKSTSPFYTCNCAANGYYGTTCKDNYCVTNSSTCKNGGACLYNSSPPFYTCNCVANGYYGTTCEERFCEAHKNQCKNNGACSSTNNDPFYSCTCAANGYYGTTCTENYCVQNPSRCKNGATCSYKSTSPFYTCNCAENGYYGNTCEEKYCSHHPNSCKNNGVCISNTRVNPFYTCNCSGTGYSGFTCDGVLIEVNSPSSTIGIVGGYANIDVHVETFDGFLTVIMYRNDASKLQIKNKTNVGNGTATFTLFINETTDEGDYLFVAKPMSNAYTRNTITHVTVHVNATITNVSSNFIFAPVTNGTPEVVCIAYGIPAPIVTWFYHTNKVSTTENTVYQTTQSESKAILHVKTAVLNDDGIYTCTAINQVGNQNLEKNSTQFVELAVYGSPNIISIDALPCNKEGKLTVNWKPNNQTTSVAHKFLAKSVNASTVQNFTVYQKISEGGKVVFDNLDPYTLYEITVEVCPDQCLVQLNNSRTQVTGHGLPGAVTNGNVHGKDDSCLVVWSQPSSPFDQITGYEISAVDTWIYQPPDMSSTFTTTNLYKADDHALNYTMNTTFNRNYSFNVTAITCAGTGESVVANGTCKTRRSVPLVIPMAAISDTSESESIREITIYLPDETNGPVSCSFVIVNEGNSTSLNGSFGITQLQEAAEAALLENIAGMKYLAIAISRENMAGGKYVTNLGSGNTTSCDISKLFIRNKLKKRSIGAANTTFAGRNKPLSAEGTVYGLFIATSTPVDDGLPMFQISQIQNFTNGEVAAESRESHLLWIVIGCCAVVLIILIAGSVFIYKRKYKSNKRVENDEVQLSQLQDGSGAFYENVTINTSRSDTDIPLKNLLQQYNLLAANGKAKFREQFQKIKETAKAFALPTTVAKSEPMLKKNRYKNILPYDSTRVVLKHNDGYINACNITGIKKKYIATQGPTPNTMKDFWQMIVEKNCRVLVMLTKCNEAGRRKCEKYWPDCNKVMEHGDINVLNKEETFFGDYVRRSLTVHTTSISEFEVIQYQFLKWPDHGVPATTSGLFRLHKAVTESYINTSQSGPLLVHCSAGVGRTGAFIGYDILCKNTETKHRVDFYNCILSMRKERVDMVQTCDQYELLHKLILERYLFGETDISEEEIQANPDRRLSYMNEEILDKQFKNLSLTESLNNDFNEDDPNKVRKNNVVIIRQPEDTEWITIDATYVQAYDRKTQLIAAQSPQNSTVEYFLRMLLDNNIDVVVMLDQSCQRNDDGVRYWPVSGNEALSLSNVTVNLEQEQRLQGSVKRRLLVSRNNNQEQKHVVTQYHYTNWRSNDPPCDTTEIKELISAIQQHVRNGNETIVLVHCSNGIGKTGVVCSLINIFERIDQEKRVDVFRAVKDLRNLRPGMVQTPNQYKYCYEVGLSQLCPESLYENAETIRESEEPLYENLN